MNQQQEVAHSADFIALDSTTSPGHCGYRSEDKVYLDVERDDDYDNSDDDICESSLDNLPVKLPSRQSGFVSHVYSRRPSDDNIGIYDQDPSLDGAKHHPKALTLPSDIWEDIFSRLPPEKLAQLRGTCRLFRRYLLNESIWKASRKQFMPEMPKPVFRLKEWEMIALVKGSSCMICGNNAYPRAIYWAFRVRCCNQCFSQNVTIESSLAESNFPAVLLTALPYGFVDASGKWVTSAMSPLPESLTRVFLNLDLKSITERYEEARAMNAEEEWLKGLESEGSKNKVDVIRMEGFESRWSARGKERQPYSTKSSSQPPAIVNCGSKENLAKTIWRQHRQAPHHLPHSHFQPQDHQYSPLVNSGVVPQYTRQHGQISLQQGRLVSAGGARGGSWSEGYVTGQTVLPQQASQPRLPAARTVTEAAEVRARRQKDIEARCLQLHPPIPGNILQHIPAYRASVLIAVPLTEQAWENLLPKLLEQREEAELKERFKVQSEVKLQELLEGQKAHEISQRELKEKKEREWDAVQAPVKERLACYATEIINSWIAQHPASYHPNTNEESALRFAPEVLIQVRKRFYDENPYSLEDPNHSILVDPSIASLEAPTGNRLFLENMKFVFDTKIKPITDKVRKELFICSGCSNNPKFYGFEGIIQHYAAKHTNLMSLGSVIVYWKADWPYYPPFILDPVAAVLRMGKQLPYTSHRQPPLSDHPDTTTFDAYSAPHHIGMHLSTHIEAPHRVITNDCFNQGHPHNACTSLSVPQPQYTQHKAIIGINQALAPSPGTNYRPLDIQRVHLEEIVVTSREAWFQLNGIKDLPSSVRVYYVIQNVVKVFQAKFPPLLLQLSMFIEALRDYQRMKPMRNVNGLQCLACATHPLHSKNTCSGMHPAGRVFTLLALVQHFEMIHVLRNKSSIKLDWKTQMVKLPEARAIGMLRDAMGMDEEKLRLLREVFPIAFNLPLPMQSSGSFIPSPGPFPNPAQPISPSSSIADSSPSPLRSVETKGSSPISEGLPETPRRLSKTLSPSPTQSMMKQHVSFEEPKRKLSFIMKREAQSPLPEIRPLKRAHISAAEKFLENFLQDEDRKVDSCPVVKSVAKYETLNDNIERRKQPNCDEYPTLEAEIQSHERPFTRRSESPPTPIRLRSNSPTIDWYYRHLLPVRREERIGRHASPDPDRHYFFDGHPPYIAPALPGQRNPRGRRSDGDTSEGRSRLCYIHPYSPDSRSRSPLCYAPLHSENAYDRTYRVDMYPRDTLLDPRDYILDRYGYTDRVESPEPRHFSLGCPRYYDTARYFEDGRRTPPFESSMGDRAHEYGYLHPGSSHHHSITYNPYSLRLPVSSRYPPYLGDRYVWKTRSRSPECELSSKKPLAASRGTYHAQFPPLRVSVGRQDEPDCPQMDSRYQELEFATSTRDCRNNPETQRFRGGYGGLDA